MGECQPCRMCVDLCVWLVCAYKAQEVHFSFSVMDLGA